MRYHPEKYIGLLFREGRTTFMEAFVVEFICTSVWSSKVSM